MFQSLTLVGRLGTDPELRYTPDGTPVCNFSLAIDQGFGDNKKTIWFKITCWRKTGEIANQYLAKGDTVAIQGSVDVDTYTTQSGEARANLVVNANHLREHPRQEPASQRTSSSRSRSSSRRC